MPNSYFQFKQFKIEQDRCAMKVTTDACLFGAWSADQIQNSKVKIQNILDVGTGTGLLSLMVAQKTNAKIDAVEIDEAAAEQAEENFNTSAWKERLTIFKDSLQSFSNFQITKFSNYDLILSNPPFFDNDLKSENEKRNLALHSSALSLEELFVCVNKLLAVDGMFALLLPYHRNETAKKIAKENNLFVLQEMHVKQTTVHGFFRTMFLFGRKEIEPIASEMAIKENDNYTAEFIELLKDYYLHL
jgi:tRNA1Val (adenine37-N6)-methyltransferase